MPLPFLCFMLCSIQVSRFIIMTWRELLYKGGLHRLLPYIS